MEERGARVNPFARASRVAIALPAALVGIFVVLPTIVALRRGVDVTRIVTESGLRDVVWFTLWQAALCAVLTLALGVPIAWLVSRREFTGRRLLRALTLVPFVLPTVVVGLAFRALFPGSLRSGVVALVVAHVFLNVAVVVRVVGARWELQPYGFEEAAATLGAGPVRRFTTVTLPMLRGAILAAGGLVFMYCFTTFGAARVLAGPTHPTTETEIYRLAVFAGDMRSAAVLAFAQIIIVSLVLGATAPRATSTATPTKPRHVQLSSVNVRRMTIAAAVAVGCVFAVPLAGLAARSLSVGDHWSLSGWRRAFGDDTSSARIVQAVVASARTAAFAALLATVGGFTLSFVRVHARAVGLRIVSVACEALPVVVSAVVVGLGFILAFRNAPFDWRGRWWLLPVAHAVVALPLVTRTISPAMRLIPNDLRHAAATLGASPLRTFFDVDVALLSRPLAAAFSLAGLVSLGEFGASSFLTRRGSETLTMTIGRLLGRPGDVVQAQVFVAATILGGLCIALVWFVDAVAGGRTSR